MAGWNVTASGEIEHPSKIRELLAKLTEVLGHPDSGTGSSEFNSPHALGVNFHAPDGQDAAGATGPADPGAGAEKPKGKSGRAAAKG